MKWDDLTLREMILDYMCRNPEAQDTAAGIAEWWLPDEKSKTPIATIEVALSDLVAQGMVLRHRGKDSQVHYRINLRRLDEIEAMLRQLQADCALKEGSATGQKSGC